MVGMSTIPEVVACRQMGVRVLGISLISNLAAGIAKHPLTHQEVIETADVHTLHCPLLPEAARNKQQVH